MGKHDLQFRKSFKDPELFRQACEIYLPDEIKSQLKLETLKLRQLSGSFIRNLIIMEYGIDPEKDPKTFEQLKAEIADNAPLDRIEDEIGDLLFTVANLARHFKLDPEHALKRTNQKFIDRFQYLERSLAEAGERPENVSLERMESLWQDAKIKL